MPKRVEDKVGVFVEMYKDKVVPATISKNEADPNVGGLLWTYEFARKMLLVWQHLPAACFHD